MKIFLFLLVTVILIALMNACQKDNEIDDQKPTIDLYIPAAFPNNCDTIYFGEAFNFNTLFTDNVELGSFSIDIHHNFDQHSHSTEVSSCQSDPIKSPVNPFVFIQDYSIPEGSNEYKTNLSITIPSNNDMGSMDEGDYHFFISLTDKEGWSAQKGLSIKILYR